MKRLLILLFFAGCTPAPEETNSAANINSNTTQQPIEQQPGIQSNLDEDLKAKIIKNLLSDEHTKIKDARWFSDEHLGVAMVKESGSMNGYAGSICIELGFLGLITPKLLIEIFDYYALTTGKGEWERIGKYDCVQDGEPPTVVEFPVVTREKPSMQNLPPPTR